MAGGVDPEAPTRSVSPVTRRDGSASPSLEAPPALAPGDRIGRYTVRRCIDRGGMGVVYEASDDELGRRVAIKLLLPGAAERDPARLLREARAAAGLSHPNVVSVYEVGTHETGLFLAMEHVDGMTVRQWLAAAPRSTGEVVRVFRQAGQGLAAAHAAGIVHRDVKPDNILVGVDRARVADFGLAAIAADSDGETRPGAVMGTPRYMAPEQRAGRLVDARSDQYSFCVALREALGDAMPAWVHRIVDRGLREDPQARHAGMDALVDALGRDPARRRRRLAGLAGAAIVAAAAAALAYRAGSLPDPCRGAADRIAGVWGADGKAALLSAFTATARPHAGATFARVAARLDGYARDWVAARQETCRARRAPSPGLVDRRMRCLDRQLARVGALVNVLRSGATETLDDAVDAVDDTTRDLCRDDKALTAAFPPPADPQTRSRVAVLEDDVNTIDALERTGRWQEAARGLEEALPEARAVDYPPLLAEVLAIRAAVDIDNGRADEAVTVLHELLRVAAIARDDALLTRAWGDLIHAVGILKESYAAALAYLPAAEAALARAGDPPAERAQLANTVGAIYRRQGRVAEARTELERGVALVEQSFGPLDPRLARTLNNLGVLAWKTGAYDEAERHLRRVIDILVVHYGDEHPRLGSPWQNLGGVYGAQRRWPEARAAHERALAIYRATLPGDHPRIAAQLHNLATVLAGAGLLDEAERAHRESLAMHERVFPPDHPERARALVSAASVDFARGRHALAHERCAAARSVLEAAGTRDQRLTDALTCVGRALVALDRPAEAIAPLAAAVDVGEAIRLDAGLIARSRHALAQALWRSGRDRTRALALARRALLDADEADRGAIGADVDRWSK